MIWQKNVGMETLKNRSQSYGYDTYGNIRSKTVDYGDGIRENYSFTYGDESWLDLLNFD